MMPCGNMSILLQRTLHGYHLSWQMPSAQMKPSVCKTGLTCTKLLSQVRNRDGHLLATLSALILSLLEAKTDCAISGAFGAGKTRAAAATVAGLIIVDPTLKIMILTKENVASQAFAEHLLVGANRYSPVAQWMSEVDLALQDESQQYRNHNATMPHKCLIL